MRTKLLQIPDDVRDVLRRSFFSETSVALPPELLARPLYEAVSKVLDAAGGKWNRAMKAHVFPQGVNPSEVFAEALQTGTIVREKQTRQAFYTPPVIADLVAKRAEIREGLDVLEPSAGGGALADAALKFSPRNLTLVEIDSRACDALVARYQKLLRVRVLCADFLTRTPRTGIETHKQQNDLLVHDRVLMNPPFTDGQEVEHVRHAFRFLKNGGRLVAIMSGAIQYRKDSRYAEFREWLELNTEDRAIESLPEEAFRESGTGVQTVMLSCSYRPQLP